MFKDSGKALKLLAIAAVPMILGVAAIQAFPGAAENPDRPERVSPAALMPPPPPPPPAPAPPAPPRDPHRHHRAWLGVVLETDEDGVTVRSVADDSPASAAGVREGDRITRIGDRSVEDYSDLSRGMRDLEPGQKVALVVERDGRERTLDVTLGESPRHRVQIVAPGDRDNVFFIGDSRRMMLGVDVHPMSSDLRRAFNAPENAGVLVNRVMDDMPARQAGIQAGDIITEVDGTTIRRVSDIRRALQDREAGDKIPVKVIRDRGERTIDVTLEESSNDQGRSWQMYVPDNNDESYSWSFEVPEGGWNFELSEEQREELRQSLQEMKDRLRESMEQLHLQMQEQREQQRDYQRQLREQLRDLRLREMEARQVNAPSYDI